MLVVLGFALLLAIRKVLVAVFLGILLATALRPLTNRLRVWRVPRTLAAGSAILLLIAIFGTFLVVIVPPALVQIGALVEDLPAMYEQLRDTLINSRYRVARQLAFNLQPALTIDMETLPETLTNQFLALLPTLGYGVFGVITTLLFAYYWLLYRERSLGGMLLLLPLRYRESAEEMWVQIEEKIGAFLRGQALLAVILAVLSLIGYGLIGLPYTLLLALVAGLMELVPFIGPIITMAIAGSIGFSVSVPLGLGAIAVGIVAQQIENILLVPRIMDRTVGVSPVVTLLAVVGFAALFGLGGALLAIPLAAVAQVLFKYWATHVATPAPEEAVQGRGPAARLRYQAQDLLQDIQQHLRRRSQPIDDSAQRVEEELEDILRGLDSILQKVENEPA
jgi:predicted PurR-regulated permease PerM